MIALQQKQVFAIPVLAVEAVVVFAVVVVAAAAVAVVFVVDLAEMLGRARVAVVRTGVVELDVRYERHG